MSHADKKRAEQLGMSYGTASNKLRKMLMFKFAQELGYNKCFVCKKEISTASELSIEHKEPWEGRPNGAEKFWDLDNIAFSHLRCNRPHIKHGGKFKRKQGKEGTAWCTKHQDFAPISSFWKRTRNWNGLHEWCIPCLRKYRSNA